MEPIITIRHLSKQYTGKTVLNDINLDIYPGQVIGYIGPNGAGKSTTVKILTGVIQDFQGDIIVAGKDLRKDVLEIKKIIGYVPELAELYDLLTPREYLTFVGKLYHLPDNVIEERSKRMLDSFGMLDSLDKRMDSFSKGMKQKILLSSSLLHNPSIVIFDEPLSGLDVNAVIMVKELLQVMKQEGKTIVYCSHVMDVVEKVSDRIVLIDKGQIVANATINELKKDDADTLEQIFARLTSTGDQGQRADEFASAFNNKTI